MSSPAPSYRDRLDSPRKREAIDLFSGLPARYDALSAALSFWQDPRWRRALVDAADAHAGDHVLDVATGTRARARFAAVEGSRIELVEGQAEALPFADASFDVLTVTYLLRYVDDPAATVRELARVLRPGGRIASLEFGVPPLASARWAWRLYTAVGLPALGRLASREWAEVGRFLGPSIRGFYERHPLERIAAYWREAGLEQVSVRRMSLGGGVLMSARRAGGGD
jgi:demethylmenaquinone methyltransferase/2-methoxy-6-polyprenyl-1,4-benzoquinol methylase